MAPLAELVAHGGVAGAIVEASVAVAVVAGLVAVWLRERSARREDAEPTEPDG
jgi:hypothetical protein